MEQFILRYGLIAIFFGAGIEGEPFALAGGVLAHRHWLSVQAALLVTIGGAYAVDQFWFHLSRHFRERKLVQRMRQRAGFARSLALIDRHPNWFVLLFRFAYGLRAVAPVAIGASQVPSLRYVLLNLAAAVVWGCLFTALGYAVGPAFEAAEARYGAWITLAAFGISALALFLALRRGQAKPAVRD